MILGKAGIHMIYITGDCHGDYHKFTVEKFPEQKHLTKKDYVIVCGDFGYWDNSAEQKYWRKWLEEKTFTTLWVDGNHENYDLLAQIDTKEWNGGKVQFITPSIIHLMRGQVYEINGYKIFTFGGARSHDITDGILEREEQGFRRKKKQFDREKKSYRINHVSWWKEEMPTEEEFIEGRINLDKNNWHVNYIITHCCASSTQRTLKNEINLSDTLTDYLQEIKEKCQFDKWFFGHYHDNVTVSEKEVLIYEQIIRIR